VNSAGGAGKSGLASSEAGLFCFLSAGEINHVIFPDPSCISVFSGAMM
jgi:hypothetical protein